MALNTLMCAAKLLATRMGLQMHLAILAPQLMVTMWTVSALPMGMVQESTSGPLLLPIQKLVVIFPQLYVHVLMIGSHHHGCNLSPASLEMITPVTQVVRPFRNTSSIQTTPSGMVRAVDLITHAVLSTTLHCSLKYSPPPLVIISS